MAVATMRQLLEAGVHFGHQAKRWNPKMKKFIFTVRSDIHVIDLQKTMKHINEAHEIIKVAAKKGGKVLFVGTKKQAQEAVAEEAKRCGMHYVNHRWLGGMLTNYDTIKKSIIKLKNIEKMFEEGKTDLLPKKEVSKLNKTRIKLENNLGGIKDMNGLPDLIFIVDTKKEEIAVEEANRLSIPIIGIVDTNCDPDNIDYPIPANDDAIRAIKLLVSIVSESVLTGRKEYIEETESNDEKLLKEMEQSAEENKETVAEEKTETVAAVK
jgi:small subunit ribosomal protein S2